MSKNTIARAELRKLAISSAKSTNRHLSDEYFKDKPLREILRFSDPITRSDITRTLIHIEHHEQREDS